MKLGVVFRAGCRDERPTGPETAATVCASGVTRVRLVAAGGSAAALVPPSSSGRRTAFRRAECKAMNRDAELEALRVGVSCAVLLEQLPPPWQLDGRESTRDCPKYRRGEGEIILVTHQDRGWWDPGSTAKVAVFSLVQRLEPELNLGQVRKLLRPLAGVSPSFPEHLRRRPDRRPSVPRVCGGRGALVPLQAHRPGTTSPSNGGCP